MIGQLFRSCHRLTLSQSAASCVMLCSWCCDGVPVLLSGQLTTDTKEGGREGGGKEREVKESRRIPEASLSHSLCKPQEWAWHVLLHDWPVPPPCQPGMETARVWGGGGRRDGACRAKGNGVRMRTCCISLQTSYRQEYENTTESTHPPRCYLADCYGRRRRS